nr:SMP-30/gluconolactonase/LRE family protein [uncultured Allomuricauda sp.]
MRTKNKISNSIVITLLFLFVSSLLSCFPGDIPSFKNAEVVTVISDFPANDALSVDRNGNVYASNFGQFEGSGGNGKALLKVNPTEKTFIEIADNLSGPLGNAVDKQGNVYVNNGNDFVNADVLKIATDGTQSIIARIEGFPSGMAIDKQKNVYVSNFTAPTVHKVAPDGEVTLLANDERLAGCVGIDFDGRGNLILGNYLNGTIYSVTMDGEVSIIASIPVAVENFVLGYLTFYRGSIFATAIGENLVYRISLDGEVSVFAGNRDPSSVDGTVLEASFSAPNGITVDKMRGILYISEFGGAGALRAIKLP